MRRPQRLVSQEYVIVTCLMHVATKKYFDRYCSVATFFYSFTPYEWRIILSTQTLSLACLENNS